jgi:hypothetical protein
MKPTSTQALLLLIVALCCTRTTVAEQRMYAVPLIDAGPPDSPLKASGQIVFHEELLENAEVDCGHCLKTRWDFDIIVTNISSKDILAYKGEINATPELGLPVREIDEPDFFFKSQIMTTGYQRVLKLDPGPTGTVDYDPSHQQPKVAKATFTVSFVEFADGSTYGTSKWGNALPKARRVTVARLQELEQAHKNGGEAALKNALDAALARKDNPSQTSDQLEHLKFIFEQDGSAALAAIIEESLTLASEHGLATAN